MVDVISSIRKIASDIRKTTSVNDDKYDKLQDIIELCDEYRDHFIDDERQS
jgi:hypothetical protein